MEKVSDQRCGWCGKPATEGHHLFLRSDIPELIDDPKNKIPLCSECHGYATNFNQIKVMFQRAFFLQSQHDVLSLEYIQDRMKNEIRIITPEEVCRFRRYLSSEYSWVSQQLEDIERKYACDFTEFRKKTTSDVQAKRLYNMTDQGMDRIIYKSQCKRIEKMMSALKTMHEMNLQNVWSAYMQ
ncbi:hypothetical protein D4R42_00185 [bacterium]|nr:MAG: hypothetical protein D4R42_00185 [bacterium]